MATRRRIATYCGFAGPIVSLGAIMLATIVAPPETFTWHGRALSDMGRYGAPTFLLFNGGLIVGGLLGFPFAWRLWLESRNSLERVGVALLAVAVIGMIGVGIFFLEHTTLYLETSLHGLAALTVFGVAPFAGWIYGTGAVLAGDPTSNYPIISDAVGLVLVFHAYRTGNLAALGSTLLLVAALGIWFLVASPSLPGVDVGTIIPASVPSEAIPPIGLAAVLAVGYALTVAEVLPQLDRVVAERVQ